MQEDLVENFGDLDEGLLEPSDLLAILLHWKRREEILPLFNEETQRAAKEKPPKLILKPLPTELKYVYLEEDKKCPIVISSLLPFIRRIVYLKSLEDLPPKKSGIMVVQNDKGEDVSTRLTTGWRVCINYRRLNAVTRKDRFSLPFIDQVLERVSGIIFYCFLDGYSGHFQIEIDVENQEKTIFTCPFGTYAYRRMPFGLCNVPATFQRCNAFDECLVNLEAVLNRYIEKDLVLNWEKCHFMVHQGIVLGHIISKQGIEVDKAKVELIVKLPSSTNVKGVRQFLGHAGFYRRFIKDFSKLARPLCEILVNDVKFIWDDGFERSFERIEAIFDNRTNSEGFQLATAL
ncbi:Retrovirus-related Pol polyprotein from transposon 17.6 [Vitis vinifera]|uniref:Retrovirus-related Pol polyprotein from transposon 17.6 n=1 Tax=Vitis vinifera TaxID=29760 RepID=A0A438HQQ1_VITVI|nr:Retrovirus-related Pol polyprotein from transposon 17.6 [Vitis vinifera]